MSKRISTLLDILETSIFPWEHNNIRNNSFLPNLLFRQTKVKIDSPPQLLVSTSRQKKTPRVHYIPTPLQPRPQHALPYERLRKILNCHIMHNITFATAHAACQILFSTGQAACHEHPLCIYIRCFPQSNNTIQHD